MKVHNFQAEPNARGGQIDLSWINPSATDVPAFQRIRIFRASSTEPRLALAGGNLVVQSPAMELNLPPDPQLHGQARQFVDTGLQNNTVYYYLIVALGPDPQTALPVGVTASALALTPWQTADELYRRLPALYQRYDKILPPAIPGLEAGLAQKGQLRRLLEMFGLQFDLLRSYADGMQDFADRERIDGALLPLLAEWIGWPLNRSLPLATQRNEIRHALPNYRTTGTAANLLATFNRMTGTDWQPEIREFTHNVFLSNAPEQLTIQELKQNGPNWESVGAITLDVAYEGRPVIVRSTEVADERLWLFYHARQQVPVPGATGAPSRTTEQSHLWLKVFDQGRWGAAQQITLTGELNKYPSAVRREDGSIWLFHTSYLKQGEQILPGIRLQVLAAGRAAAAPQWHGEKAGPFILAEGDQFILTINQNGQSLTRTVTMRSEQFANLAAVTTTELADLLNREIPNVTVTAGKDQKITITAQATGTGSRLSVPVSTIATKLEFLPVPPAALTHTGTEAERAVLTSTRDLSLAARVDNLTLTLSVDGGFPRVVTFPNNRPPGPLTLDELANQIVGAINQVFPGLATILEPAPGVKRVRLTSPTAGTKALIVIDVNASTAADKLGFGAPLPPFPDAEDAEPAALLEAGRLWLFWSSRRTGRWQLWYNFFNGTNWGAAPKQLTTGGDAEREPVAVLDERPAPDRRMWVFWSNKNEDGRWNILFRSTTKFDFATLADADWTGPAPLSPVVESYDRREPWPVMTSSGAIDLYFSANRADGWQIWAKRVPSAAGVVEQPVTTGRFTHRAPTALVTIDRVTRMWLRSNESVLYESPSYPAAKTLDLQYTGSTTADTRNEAKLSQAAKLNRPGTIDDVQRYSYDTGRGELDWYARDTIGIFYQPPPGLVVTDPKLQYIRNALARGLQMQLRVVLIRKA